MAAAGRRDVQVCDGKVFNFDGHMFNVGIISDGVHFLEREA